MSQLSIVDSRVHIDGVEIDPDAEIALSAGSMMALVQAAATDAAQTYFQKAVDEMWPHLVEAFRVVPVRVVQSPRRITELSRGKDGKPIGSVSYDDPGEVA